MKNLWLLLALITPLQLIHAQEIKHAPTAEQCRAEQKLWSSMLQPGKEGGADVAKVGYSELVDWSIKMGDCGRSDPERKVQYYKTEREALLERLWRFQNFVHRRNLWSQFLAEDAQHAGKGGQQ